ncbi:hypothetical protein V8C26DRAFT_387663 [Trichoderma gracile]
MPPEGQRGANYPPRGGMGPGNRGRPNMPRGGGPGPGPGKPFPILPLHSSPGFRKARSSSPALRRNTRLHHKLSRQESKETKDNL